MYCYVKFVYFTKNIKNWFRLLLWLDSLALLHKSQTKKRVKWWNKSISTESPVKEIKGTIFLALGIQVREILFNIEYHWYSIVPHHGPTKNGCLFVISVVKKERMALVYSPNSEHAGIPCWTQI